MILCPLIRRITNEFVNFPRSLIMPISRSLKGLHNCGDYGDALRGLGSEVSRLEDLLKESAALFRTYEESHRARGPEHLEKANRNADIAGRIEATLREQAPW
jgi:hypothetical protein